MRTTSGHPVRLLAAALLLTSTVVGQKVVQKWLVREGPHGRIVLGIAYDPGKNEMWVIDDWDIISRHERTGRRIRTFPVPRHPKSSLLPGLVRTSGVAVDPRTGTAWVADAGLVIYEITPDGAMAGRGWPHAAPWAVSITRRPETNTIFAAGNRTIREFTTEGKLIRSFTVASKVQVIDALTYNPTTRTLLLSDTVLDKVFEANLNGKILREWNFSAWAPVGWHGLALDTRTGSVFMSDFYRGAVYEFSGMIGPCSGITSYGKPCLDRHGVLPSMTASDCPRIGSTFSILTVGGDGALAMAIYAVGSQRASIDLGKGCTFWTLPLVILPPVTYLHGRAGVDLPIPALSALRGVRLDFHALLFEGGTLSVPNGLELTLQ